MGLDSAGFKTTPRAPKILPDGIGSPTMWIPDVKGPERERERESSAQGQGRNKPSLRTVCVEGVVRAAGIIPLCSRLKVHKAVITASPPEWLLPLQPLWLSPKKDLELHSNNADANTTIAVAVIYWALPMTSRAANGFRCTFSLYLRTQEGREFYYMLHMEDRLLEAKQLAKVSQLSRDSHDRPTSKHITWMVL